MSRMSHWFAARLADLQAQVAADIRAELEKQGGWPPVPVLAFRRPAATSAYLAEAYGISKGGQA